MLPGGPSLRSPEVQRAYFDFMETKVGDGCDFCDLENQDFLNYEPTEGNKPKDWAIIRNKFPYELWEDMYVADHLLAIPRRHIAGIEGLSNRESTSFVRLLGKYSLLGYSAYTRSTNNKAKSVVHLHTHLISFDHSKGHVDSMNYTRDPHVVDYHMSGGEA